MRVLADRLACTAGSWHGIGVEHSEATRDRNAQGRSSLADTVHICLLHLDADTAGEAAWGTLTPDEKLRAERFHFKHDRERWVAARAGLRTVLGGYIGRPPRALRFGYGPRGKPALIGEPGELDLRFNLSHSETRALIALAAGRELGVDVEAIRADRDVDAIAARVFSSLELAMLAALPPELRIHGFYNAWTRKEAYIKARGEGLWLELQSFDVTLAPKVPARLLNTRPDPQEAARWTLYDVDAGEGFAAAVAIEGPCRDVIVREWP